MNAIHKLTLGILEWVMPLNNIIICALSNHFNAILLQMNINILQSRVFAEIFNIWAKDFKIYKVSSKIEKCSLLNRRFIFTPRMFTYFLLHSFKELQTKCFIQHLSLEDSICTKVYKIKIIMSTIKFWWSKIEYLILLRNLS